MLEWDAMGVVIACIVHSHKLQTVVYTLGLRLSATKAREAGAETEASRAGYRRNTADPLPSPSRSSIHIDSSSLDSNYSATSSLYLNSRRLDLHKECHVKAAAAPRPSTSQHPARTRPTLVLNIASWNRDTRSVSAYPRSSRPRPATASTGVESRALSRSRRKRGGLRDNRQKDWTPPRNYSQRSSRLSTGTGIRADQRAGC
jgi:hypothetical protein